MTTIKVLKVALCAGRLLTGIPIPLPSVPGGEGIGLGCTDTDRITDSLEAAWDLFSLAGDDLASSSSSVDTFDYSSRSYTELVGEAYQAVHSFVISAEANQGRPVVLEDHLRGSIERVMSPHSGAVGKSGVQGHLVKARRTGLILLIVLPLFQS